ncbi:MAG: cation-translocating P-type ATPase [Acidobacteriota bacterium]
MKEEQANYPCDLCQLPVGRHPFQRQFNHETKWFCCLGCTNVYAILLESGVIDSGEDIRETEIFKRSLQLGLISTGRTQSTKKSTLEIPQGTPTEEALIQVSGMWCSSCAWLIEHALSNERGVVSAEAFFASDLVKVRYCPQYLPPDRITQRIKQLGYQASEYTGDNEAAQTERRDLILRLGIAGFLWLNIMTLSTALYVGYFEQINESLARFLPFVLMALAAPVIFFSAKTIMQLAWQGFINRTVRMETLLGLGILAAYVYSSIQAFRGETHVYFDTASAIVTLVLLGKLIERGAKERTSKAITMLYRLMPKKVRLYAGGLEKFVSIEALSVDDIFVVKAGERIPADGVVVEGASHTDESLLTGESSPIAKGIDSPVVSGSVNVSSVLHIRATKVGNDTTLAQIIRLVEHALSSRSAIERTVDKVSRIFVPGVIVVAVSTFAICWLGGFTNLGDALMRAITVLVIACPCALGMATPLAITAAIGAASRSGILVSDSRVLETIRKVDVVILDKTGTITEGNFALLDFDIQPETVMLENFIPTIALQLQNSLQPPVSENLSDGIFKTHYLPMLAGLERCSEHPLGRAVINYAEHENIDITEAREVQIHKGLGITGKISNKRIFIGNRKLAESEARLSGSQFLESANQWERQGRTVAFFGWQGAIKGVLAFGDQVKPEARQVVNDLRARGIKTLIVSGDAQDTTAWITKQVGADEFIAEALPDDKTQVIERLQQQGKVVAMIGDGINDAPALAKADLGIAVGSGADLAMRAAAMVLMSNSLTKVIEAFEISRKTWRVVRQNLFWAFVYNTLSISLAVTGVLNPLLAAAAMLLSSLSVIGNSQRLSASLQKRK